MLKFPFHFVTQTFIYSFDLCYIIHKKNDRLSRRDDALYEIEKPTERLAKNYIKIKVIRAILSFVITLVVIGLAIYGIHKFSLPNWVLIVAYISIVLAILNAIWTIFLEPFFQYKNWRHRVDEHYLQLTYGGIKRSYQLVPMTKVQSVETNQGPLLRRYKLYSLTIQTTGSTHYIPALSENEAIALRNQIAHYAQIKEVE